MRSNDGIIGKEKLVYKEEKSNIFHRCKGMLKKIFIDIVLSYIEQKSKIQQDTTTSCNYNYNNGNIVITSHMDTVNWLLPIWIKVD